MQSVSCPSLKLDLDDRGVDAAAAGYHAALRHDAIDDTRLMVGRLRRAGALFVAASSDLDGRKARKSIAELEQHDG
jgi:hypothetical protein